MIHARSLVLSVKFDGTTTDLIRALREVDNYAHFLDHTTPYVEMQTDGDPTRVNVWEETLSDGSQRLVAQLC